MTALVGDKVLELSSVADGAYLTIQPVSGEEWTIQMLCWGATVELYFYDGTNSILMSGDSLNGSRINSFIPVTNSQYYRLKNVSGGSAYFGYGGVVTKEI